MVLSVKLRRILGRCGGLLRGDDLPLVLHCQLSVQPLKYIHHRSGIARSVRGRAVTAGVRQRYFTVLSRPTLRLYFRQEGCIEAHLRVQDAICGL